MVRYTTKSFIEKSIAIHGEKYDYSKSIYIHCNKKIIIICRIHGEFEIAPRHHLEKQDCKKCAKKQTIISQRNTQEQFIDRAITTHGSRYNYSKVKYIDSRTKVIIICSEHGEFTQIPNNHIRGNGCSICAINCRANQINKTTEEFIKESKNIHKNKYDYSITEYINSDTRVSIICPEHGIFHQFASAHLHGCGCKKCSMRDVGNARRYTIDEITQKFKAVYGNMYDYTYMEYKNYITTITISCSKHGIFRQTPCAHINGKGCPRCIRLGRISKISQEWLSMIKSSSPLLELEYHIPSTNYFADGYDPDSRTIYEFHGDYWHGNPKIFLTSIMNERTKCTMGQLYENTIKKRETCISLGYRYIEVWEHTWKKCKKLIQGLQRRIILTRQSKAHNTC
jgi:G:T-mismatch repair DNA endonuclease (very short patch repair protein)